jgi:hypothetical protein
VELAPGKAELLCRLLAANPAATAVGVDRSPWFLADARVRSGTLGVAARLELHEADATAFEWPRETADLAIAIGSSGILGAQAGTLAALGRMARGDGGLVLFGDGVWLDEPPLDGLAAFGMERAELPDGLEGQRALGEATGLRPVWSELVSIEEWDAYERAYAEAISRWAQANPEDPELRAFVARSALMRDSYAAWRRDTFGFGITLFRRL